MSSTNLRFACKRFHTQHVHTPLLLLESSKPEVPRVAAHYWEAPLSARRLKELATFTSSCEAVAFRGS